MHQDAIGIAKMQIEIYVDNMKDDVIGLLNQRLKHIEMPHTFKRVW